MKQPTPFGKYVLLERINIGGMAEVFRAKAFGVEGFERLVAVKRILPNVAEDKDFIRMFVEEAKLSVQLTHANIAQIFDLGVVDGSYYIALEHVHGRDLRGIYDRCRQLGEVTPVAQACFIAMKVCEGLDYAHNKRDQAGHELALVHRDVSPQNILVSFEGEVKLIDFGIAKAAGTGSKTQAGILKGKFGYMSPEQVRGVQVDRRSDVFSCGIVLYELLTGERLFVGDSDFSTLEKVRNVEILPPSTYNRKIPEELERIVLKALAKDVEDRFQNAIDLHDELQAFVYTTGEFYSRKDLAGWMKKMFGKEIEDETIKLESYRQLRSPTGAERSAATTPPPPRKPPTVPMPASRSQPMPVAAPTSAPIAVPIHVIDPAAPERPAQVATPTVDPAPASPASPAVMDTLPARSQPVAVIESAAVRSQPVPVEPAAVAKSYSQPVPVAVPVPVIDEVALTAAPAADTTAPVETIDTVDDVDGSLQVSSQIDPSALGWDDDDEVETHIYADQDNDIKRQLPAQRASLPLQPPLQSSPAISVGGEGAFGFHAPDAMAHGNAGGWDHPDRTEASSSGGFPEMSVSGGTQLGIASPPAEFPSGSNNVDPRFAPRVRRDGGTGSGARELSAARVLVSARPPSDLPYDPMASFGARITGASGAADQRRSFLMVALGGGAVAVVTMIVVILLSGSSRPTAQVAAPPVAPRPPPVIAADPNTGFDLYVVPSGLTQWKLDGESRTDRLPSRIRGISVGLHSVQIEPPPGFLSQLQQVAVEQGKAPRIDIKLQPIPGIVGMFESTPPGATVSLIVDGKRQTLGAAPAKVPLDPRSTYQVLFEKPGYVSVNRPISFSGGLEERVAVQLEKASVDKSAPVVEPRPRPQPQPRVVRPAPERAPDRAADKPAPEPSDPAADPASPTADSKLAPDSDAKARGQGVLVLGSKPPCEIYIDGNPTGLRTPQKEIRLSIGRHRITLVNNEFGIRESFNADIKAEAPEKQIKDYSDRLPR